MEFGAAQLSSPRGLAARYDLLHDRYDVYVCDTGHRRLTKWAYRPDAALDPASWSELLYTWNSATSTTDLLRSPRDIELVESDDGVYLVVSDSTRLLIYRDDDPPVFVAAVDSALGPWRNPQGLAVMPEDSGLQIYATDAASGSVTKLLRRNWLIPGPADTSVTPVTSPTLNVVDSLDSDGYLLLQPGAVRTVELRLSGADSLTAVDLYGAFPPNFVRLLAIRKGEIWNGTSAVSQSFSASVDSVGGRFAIHSAILGDAAGVSSAAPRVVARLILQADAAMEIPASGAISLFDSSTLRRVNLSFVSAEIGDSLQLRGSYLADIASAGVDPGVPPAMMPVPDGHIDFEDVAVFVRAWTGDGNTFDPLADLGPLSGEAPTEYCALPDGRLDAQDLLALSTMYSWEAARAPQLLLPPAVTEQKTRNTDAPVAVVVRQNGEGWTLEIRTRGIHDLSSARLLLDLPAAEALSAEAGPAWGSSALFLQTSRGGKLEICAGRLRRASSSSGVLARIEWRNAEPPDIALAYDLRGSDGKIIAQGSTGITVATQPLEFSLSAPYPNPFNSATTFTFTLAEAGHARLRLFNLLGQDLGVILDQKFAAGTHEFRWQAQDIGGRSLPTGLYLVRLETAGHGATRKVILLR